MGRTRGLVLLMVTLVVATVTGCGGASEDSPPLGNEAPESVATPSQPAKKTGPPVRYADENGFEYTLGIYEVSSTLDLTKQGGSVAQPGYIFPAFTGELTNVQTDRPAPLPEWLQGHVHRTGPVVGGPKAVLKDSVSACDSTGFCSLDLILMYVCAAQDASGQRVTDLKATIPAGAVLQVGCIAKTAARMTEKDIMIRLDDQALVVPGK